MHKKVAAKVMAREADCVDVYEATLGMEDLRIAGSLAWQIQTDLGVLQNRWLHIPSILPFVRFYHFFDLVRL